MKLVFSSLYDISNVKIWSGTIHFMSEGLKKQNIELLHPKNFKMPFNNYFRGKSFLLQKIFKTLYFKEREPIILKNYAKFFNKQFSNLNYDWIFAAQTADFAYLDTKKPMAFWVDATFAALLEQLQGRIKFNDRAIQLGHKYDKMAFEKATLAFFASDWAANSAIEYYKLDPKKVRVVPFGANLKWHPDYDNVLSAIENRKSDKLKILFIAVDWEQKGGDKVLDIVNELNRRGIKTELNVVGCKPDVNLHLPDYVKVHGFISKNSSDGMRKLTELYSQSHFMIMLSRQEAFGLVFCEANAFGVPAIGPEIGGVPTIIKNNINGFLVNEHLNVENITEQLIKLFEDKEQYKQLAISSYNEYQSNLSWEASCRKVKSHLENAMEI